jgi:hypothetical protein
MADELAPEEELDPLQAFPPEWQLTVTGLAFLGQLTDEFTFCGHRYTLKTLKPQEKISIGIVLQPTRNTLYEELAWQTAHVAVALTSIDGNTEFCPPSTKNLDDFVRGRIAFIADEKTGWETPLVGYVWKRLQRLELLSAQAVARLDLFLQGPPSSHWPDSLTEPGLSSEPTSSDTLPSESSSSDS